MAITRITVNAAPETVYEVLADGRSYEKWLVGCKRIRDVDTGWPTPGTRIHHRVGLGGPLTLDDTTKSLEEHRPNYLRLEARARPIGVAEVRFDIEPTDDGRCEVVIREEPIRGFAKTVHNPVLDVMIAFRNRKSLRQLRALSEAGQSRHAKGATG